MLRYIVSLFCCVSFVVPSRSSASVSMDLYIELSGRNLQHLTEGSLEATLLLTPEGNTETGIGVGEEPLKIDVRVPGQVKVSLPEEGIWKYLLLVDGFWSATQAIDVMDSKSLTIPLFPVGEAQGRLRNEKSSEVSVFKEESAIKVEFAPTPTYRFEKEPSIPAASHNCDVFKAALRCKIPAGRLDLRISADGFAPIYRWGVDIKAGEVIDIGELDFVRGGSISGWVETTTGDPVDGVEVQLDLAVAKNLRDPVLNRRFGRMNRRALTNDRGFFQVRGTPPGAYRLSAIKEGFSPAIHARPVTVRRDTEELAADRLILARPVILGLDLYPKLDPFQEPWVIELSPVDHAHPTERQSSTASAEGSWKSFKTSPGLYHLFISDSKESTWVTQEIEILKSEEIFFNIPVVELEGSVSLDGVPASGTLWISGKKNTRLRFEVDEEGKFGGLITDDEEAWSARIEAETLNTTLHLSEVLVERSPGTHIATLDIELPDTHLEGDVIDEAGQPVSGALVMVYQEKRGLNKTETDDQGRFEIRGIEPGFKVVSASQGSDQSDNTSVNVDIDMTPPRLRLTLQSKVDLEGQVTFLGNPVVGARLLAWHDLQTSYGTNIYQVTTGIDGAFNIKIKTGSYWMNFAIRAPGFSTRVVREWVDSKSPVFFSMDQNGGDLLVDWSNHPNSGASLFPNLFLVHDGVAAPIPLLYMLVGKTLGRASLPQTLELINIETGPYQVCTREALFRLDQAGSESDCLGGILSLGAQLTLAVPEPDSEKR